MTQPLPPFPTKSEPGSFAFMDWYEKLQTYLTTTGSIPWTSLNFAGSNLTQIQTRNHNDLQSVQGGSPTEQYHLSLAQYNALGAAHSTVIANNSSAQSIPNGAFTTVTNWNVTTNTGSNFTASTGIYLVASTGTFDVRGAISLTAAVIPAGTIIALGVLRNGGLTQQTTIAVDATITTALRVNGAFRIEGNATDTISLAVFQNSGGAITLDGSINRNFLSIRQD